MADTILSSASLVTALGAELAADAEFLPRQPVDDAAAADIDAARTWLDAEKRRLSIRPTPVVAVHKWRYGRRPVSVMPLEYRAAYRSVIDDLSSSLWRARDDNDHEDFIKAPITSGAAFIVSTDLSNYYSTIHINTLMHELLAVSGEWEKLNWLSVFLEGVSGRPYGLPQGSGASDRLGDTFAELLADALRRRGIQTWRFADDFRFGCSDRQSAVRALEIFDDETRRMGLYVNERKTDILKVDDYIKKSESKRKALTDAWAEARESLEVTDIYRNIVISAPTREQVDVQAAEQEMDAWWFENLFESNPQDARIDLTVLLAILGQAGNTTAVDKVADIIEVHPEAGRAVATYLRQVSEVDLDAGTRGLMACLEGPITRWHDLWLVDVILRGGKPPSWSSYPEKIRNWLTSLAFAESVAAAPAALAMARHGGLPEAALERLFVDPDSHSLPYLLAATTKVTGPGFKNISNSRLLEGFVTNWARLSL